MAHIAFPDEHYKHKLTQHAEMEFEKLHMQMITVWTVWHMYLTYMHVNN